MKKQDFVAELRRKLAGLPKQDIEERINFYSEMIDDRMEDGISEDDAVSEIGSVDDIASQIIADIPFTKIAKERIKPKRKLKAWEIVLLAVGSPIWLSLGIAVVAIIFSLYVVLWSVIVSLWAVFASLIASAVGCVLTGIAFAIVGNGGAGGVSISFGIVCAGLAIFCFFGCKAATKGVIVLTKKIAIGIKKCFVRKEEE